LLVLGAFDFAYQWWEYEKSLKMTKQEVKEEFKQQEGNPEIKSRIRQKQRQLSMRRMMQEVPKADVVITNPTHFACALKYDEKISPAPVLLAKGQDYIALRIKEIAAENDVEVVENKPLARTIYETVEIGEAIPPELYQAVAEVLAFVYSLKGKTMAG
jgi:flagellar biosynthetic protein FlhB